MTNAIQNLIRISDPSQSGKSRVVGFWPGPDDGPLAQIRRESVRAAESLLRGAYDIRGNRNFGPVEAGTRLREAAAPALKTLNDAASKLRERKDQLRQQVMMLNPIKGYDKLGYWQPQFDIRLIDAFHAKSPSERALFVEQMRREPLMHLDFAEALLRVPRPLAGLDDRQLAVIRLALVKTLKTADFEALDLQIEQTRVAERALREAIEAIVDTTGNVADMVDHAPDAFALRMDRSDPVSWLPPEPEPVQWTPEPKPVEPAGNATGEESSHAG